MNVGALRRIKHAGKYVAFGRKKALPILEPEGFGALPLPVVPALLPGLLQVATEAPYGRGPDTVVDPDVRRCHQISAERVSIPPAFAKKVAGITRTACKALGVATGAESRLYKLLVYGPGVRMKSDGCTVSVNV